MNNAEKLMKLKKEVDTIKTEVARLTGVQDQLKKDLERFKCKTISEAEVKLEEMEQEIEELEAQIEKGIEEIESKYGLEV